CKACYRVHHQRINEPVGETVLLRRRATRRAVFGPARDVDDTKLFEARFLGGGFDGIVVKLRTLPSHACLAFGHCCVGEQPFSGSQMMECERGFDAKRRVSGAQYVSTRQGVLAGSTVVSFS